MNSMQVTIFDASEIELVYYKLNLTIEVDGKEVMVIFGVTNRELPSVKGRNGEQIIDLVPKAEVP